MPCLVEPYFLSARRASSRESRSRCQGSSRDARSLIFRRDGHALVHDVGHLSPQALAIQSHAVAQDVHHTLAEDAGGQQVQGKLAELVHHGMAGVAAALIADHHVVVRGHQVYHAALALVSPVDSHDGTI